MANKSTGQVSLFEQHAVGQTIPFGKYKNEPLEVLLTDPEYVTWLRATMHDKLSSQYPAVLQFIVAHYGEPSRTPEHNALQNRFLKREFQLKFALAAYPEIANWVQLEQVNLELLFEQHFAEREKRLRSSAHNMPKSFVEKTLSDGLDALSSEKILWREELRLFANTGTIQQGWIIEPVQVSKLKFEEGGSDVVYGVFHSWEFARLDQEGYPLPHEGTLASCDKRIPLTVQIKPLLGDDYPAVLRAMKAAKSFQLLVRDYTGRGASWDEVKQVFALDSIRAVLLDEVEAVQIPASFEKARCPSMRHKA